MTKRIKSSEIPKITELLRQKQGNVCALCRKPFTARDYPVVDHCHETGFIRGLLHNSCNGIEGKVKKLAQRGHAGVSSADYIIGLGRYLELHKIPQVRLLHHQHLNQDEKREERNRKARLARAKKKAKK